MKFSITNSQSTFFRRLSLASLFFTLSLAGTAVADIQARSSALSDCLERQIDAELNRESPSGKNVLDNCATEFKALEKLLPPDTVKTIRHELDHVISDKLKAKAS